MDNTVCDFWRMVWEQHLELILMLTNLEEYSKTKCAKYWPDEAEGDKMFGDFGVAHVREKRYSGLLVASLYVLVLHIFLNLCMHTCVYMYVCVCVCVYTHTHTYTCTRRVSCVRVYMDLGYIVTNVPLSRKCGKFLDYTTKSLFYCSRTLLSSASEKCNDKYRIFPVVLKKVLFYLL